MPDDVRARRDALVSGAVAEAARIAGAPVALAGVVMDGREAMLATHGWAVRDLPLPASFAARLIHERDVVVISDASADPRFANHPLVTHAPRVRFLAVAPLLRRDGSYAGALSVMDGAVRNITRDQVQMLALLARDISRELELVPLLEELDRAKDMLDESSTRFREFFEQTDDLVMSIAPDGRLLHANVASSSALGVDHDALMRAPLTQMMDGESRETFRAAVAEAFASGEPQRVETTFLTSDRRKLTVEGSLRPRFVDGKPMLARVIFRDITDRKQFESELGSARDAALEAARLKSQFLTNVSHEIRTPMNGIVGTIDLLLSTPLNADQKELALQARASAGELLSIVNNVLYVSNIEAGGLGSANVDFDLFRTLQRIVEVVKVAALGKDLEILYHYDTTLPPILRGNQSKLRQVVSNLLDNAVKFTEQGRVSLRVIPQTETATHHVVRFEIRDTGIGIDEEHRLLLFEKFSQVDAGSNRRFQGVGLGLATARQLVETMGGLMDVDSKPGFGSTFWFSIPFQKTSRTDRPIASSDLDFKGKRVLLIDRAFSSRRIIRHYLETTWEMRVEVAETAADAMALMKREAAAGDPIRVVIFDAMPDADAMTFARMVHKEPALAKASLVQLTQMNEHLSEAAMREVGIAAFTTKPAGQRELFDAITVALAHDALALARPALAQAPDRREVPPEVPRAERAKLRILLAEDNFLNRKLTLSQMEKLGYGADSVANGKEAVEAMARTAYDMILMDCQMPIVDGYEATMQIRKQEQGGKRAHIIAMTANALEGDREKCLAAGMDDYLAKPTKQEDLDVALARAFAAIRSRERSAS